MLTSRMVRDFLESPVWLEIEQTLRARKRLLQQEVNKPTNLHEQDLLLKGALAENEVYQAMPREILAEFEEKEELKQEERENG